MADWSTNYQDANLVTIHTGSFEAIGVDVQAMALAAPASTALSSTALGTGYFIPFTLQTAFRALQMLLYNGSTVGGTNHFDLGIYDSEFNLIVHSGSIAQSGTTTIQAFDITDTDIYPGVYYMAASYDATLNSDTVFTYTFTSGYEQRSTGVTGSTGANFPLATTPATTAMASTTCPVIGITGRTLV